MSKSKKNTIDPDDIIAAYGADTARWFMLSDSPPERDVIWTEEGVQGARRFVQRLWRLVGEIAGVTAPAPRPASSGSWRLKCARPRIERLRHVTTMSTNFVSIAASPISTSSPMRSATPSVRSKVQPADDLAVGLARGGRYSRAAVSSDDAASGGGVLGRPWAQDAGRNETWPKVEPDLLVENTVTLPVQINGKKRAEVSIGRNATIAEIEAAVLALDEVKKALNGKSPKKVIVVPQRIVNVVV